MYNNLVDISSDEEDYLPPAPGDYRPRREALLRPRHDFLQIFDDKKFHMRFRLEKPTVINLLGEIEPQISTRTNRNNAIPPMTRLLIALRFFATGCFLITVGDFVGISPAAAAYIVTEVTVAIVSLRRKYIKMPDAADRAKYVKDFFNMAKFPRVIGVVDGTHIRIQSPGGHEPELYRNRKQYFSKNVQVVAGPALQILDIVTAHPGSCHDQTIFNLSLLSIRFENDEFGDKLLLGDAGYECRPYIMTPLNQVTTPEENLYQESLIRTRQTVERCFGVWKRRFPILSKGIRVSLNTLDKADYYIVACAILHNLAIFNHEDEPPIDPDVVVNLADIGDIPTEAGIEANERYQVRRGLIENYFATLL